MISNFLFKNDAKEWYDWQAGVAATGHMHPHTMFLGDYRLWKVWRGWFGFDDMNDFAASIISHETIHQLLYKILSVEAGSKASQQFDKLTKRLLFTPFDYSLLRTDNKET